jgi:hypothetical protein
MEPFLFIYLSFYNTYMTSIYNHSFIIFTEADLHIFYGSEPRFEIGPALRQASAITSELGSTLLSYAAPCVNPTNPLTTNTT